MRFDSKVAFGLFSVALVGFGNVAFADEIDDALGDAATPSAASSSTATVAIDKPTFSPLAIKAPFYEQFTPGWDSRWKVSHAKKENDKTGDEEWTYVGQWAVEEPTVLKGIEGDTGLVVKNVAAHHAISAKFDKPIDNKGKTLVVQYEVKLQEGLECGGAYLKLLKENADLHAEEFSNASPYVIMFGPDKCGATNKVHFIFKHKNPKTGEYEEKHLKSPPMARISKQSTLYTLIVNPDQTYVIKMDGSLVKSGSLFEDFAPSDWDEDAPFEIIDEEAEKPEDWLEDEPEFIPDPEAPNPAHKGKWSAPMIDNPDYKGPWAPRKIPNPDYFEDKTPSNFEPMGAIGFELWTMTKDILFDNIYIGHSIQDAEKLQKGTFDVKKKIEQEEDAASAPKIPEAPKAPGETTFKENPVTFVRDKLEIFFAAAQKDPVFAIKEFPIVVGGLTAFLASFIAILFGLIFSGSSPAPAPKAAATDGKDKVEAASEGSSTESEKPKATRRTSKKAE
ncbi:Calreticulin-domain-containing protein [Tuber magnatum]|uniref:Calreticulin-domain-containing protein n=1 Tax=Tuber magnatum TaxID=42249 RepID=A0A317SJ40_9PEZI|nr:Calreticulin-domain-containing protein [Tuber magnatum]